MKKVISITISTIVKMMTITTTTTMTITMTITTTLTPTVRYPIRYLATRDFGGLCGVMGMRVGVMVSMRGRWLAEPGVRRRREIGITATTAATTASAASAAAAAARLVTQIRRWSWHHAARSPWNHTVCVSRKLRDSRAGIV